MTIMQISDGQGAGDDSDPASDEDFDPSATTAQPVESSSEEDDNATSPRGDPAKRPRKRASTHPSLDEDLDFDNSGDEATIQKGRRKKQKTQDEEGGEGGLIKTRAQRKAEIKEKRPLAETSKASVDVNALWAELATSATKCSTTAKEQSKMPQRSDDSAQARVQNEKVPLVLGEADVQPESTVGNHTPAMITIKRKYDFAGQTMEEERQVSASSAEAKLYIAEQQRDVVGAKDHKPPVNRPKKRKTALDMTGLAVSTAPGGVPKKLNTIEKSKLDWASHVDKEGIADELDEHSRAKGGYLGRMDFLDRMTAKRGEDAQTKPA